MIEFDRTTQEYTEFAIISEIHRDPNVIVPGMISPVIPQSFEELEAEVNAHRNPNCDGSKDADDFIEALRSIPNRDYLVQALPADGEHIVFVIPRVN